ncbi:MAG: hypothetical protein QNJ98_04560 [Planctomycetota bacterium]|nr:hypothetical protein [Planctomycetota bacterium]
MDPHDPEARLARLLAELDAAGASPDDLDPNDLARLAASETPDDVRAAILARLSAEDAAVAAAVAAEAAERPAARAASASRPWLVAAAVAAVVLVAIGGFVLFGERGPETLGDDDLVATFASLGRDEPAVFAGIEPLLATERREGGTPLRRGGIQVAAPHGAILTKQPALRWEGIEGASLYAIEILSDDGDVVLSATSEAPGLDWPADAEPLAAGTAYVLRISAIVAGLKVEGTRAFRVPAAEDVARYRRALEVIDAEVAPALRDVAKAHVALRFELLTEASRHVEAEPAASARALVLETRERIDRQRGVR